MRIERGERIGELDGVETRARLRRLGNWDTFELEDVVARCGLIDAAAAASWTDALTNAGLVHRQDSQFVLTTEGLALRGATVGAGYKRATALRTLHAFDARVERLQQEPMEGFAVSAAVVFGSILDRTRERVGDVDVAVELDVVDQAAVTLPGADRVHRYLKGGSRVLALVELGTHRSFVTGGQHLYLWRDAARVTDVRELEG